CLLVVHNPEKNNQKPIFIQDYVQLKDNVLSHAEKTVYHDNPDLEIKLFAKACYDNLGMNYPKFHKMDNLCKLGIIASEILLKNTDFSENTALILSNNASSLDTDEKHWE